MADKKHLQMLARGVKTWNAWRKRSRVRPDLSRALLIDRELRGINLAEANLERAILRGTTLSRANLTHANLRRADLRTTSLRRARLDHAILTGAILRHASLAETSVEGSVFERCEIYGIAAWNLKGQPKVQSSLIIRASSREPAIEVDDLEVAQFIYLLLDNQKITQVVDTVGKKAVLILGRFSAERKAVLDAVKEALRSRGYLPMLFDFEKPQRRDLTETITTLARMSRFIVADLTDPSSIPQELATIVPDLPSVPVAPVILAGARPYAMFEHLRRYAWVLPVVRYRDTAELLGKLPEAVIDKAEKRAARQTRSRTR
ncbi:MAG TPA: pentapeptide repeat-containing protein [Burkholderiales bacterium]|nr:pentapeptide repeat-containing protein [Burkholderiales bacterium]